jgi:hypothetical protein
MAHISSKAPAKTQTAESAGGIASEKAAENIIEDLTLHCFRKKRHLKAARENQRKSPCIPNISFPPPVLPMFRTRHNQGPGNFPIG